MHATHSQGDACPEPTRRLDGQPETAADRRFYYMREAGWTGWLDGDGYPVDRDGERLDLGLCELCGQTGISVSLAVTTCGHLVVCIDSGTCSGDRSVIDPATAALLEVTGDRYGFKTTVAEHTEPSDAEPELSDSYVVTEAGHCAIAETSDSTEPDYARVLRLAALYLQLHGWCQGAYYDPAAGVFTPAADMAGAIAMVCYGGPVEAPAQMFDHPEFLDFEEAMLHLDRYLLVMDGTEAYEFNDAKGRTADVVIDVMRRAAAVPASELIDALRIVHADDTRRADLFGGDGK